MAVRVGRRATMAVPRPRSWWRSQLPPPSVDRPQGCLRLSPHPRRSCPKASSAAGSPCSPIATAASSVATFLMTSRTSSSTRTASPMAASSSSLRLRLRQPPQWRHPPYRIVALTMQLPISIIYNSLNLVSTAPPQPPSSPQPPGSLPSGFYHRTYLLLLAVFFLKFTAYCGAGSAAVRCCAIVRPCRPRERLAGGRGTHRDQRERRGRKRATSSDR